MKSTKTKNHLAAVFFSAAVSCLPSFTSGGWARSESFTAPASAAISRPSPNPGEEASYPETLHGRLELAKAGLDIRVLETALKGFDRLSRMGKVSEDSILVIADFSKSSKEKRLYVIDLKQQRLVYRSLVAHGRNSGAEFANRFSNKPSSNMSSLGFYLTRGTYNGSNGYSLVLDGCEKGINDKARERAIVMHAADYANEEVVGGKGYLGRSFGCPALPEKMNRKVIDRIKGGNVLFIYHPQSGYLDNSPLLNG